MINMYRSMILRDFIFFIFLFGGILFTLLIVFMSFGGTLNIELPYKSQYNQCQDDLNYCEESKVPNCAPCVCKESNGYWILYVLPTIIYFATIFNAVMTNKKLREREKELDKQEQEIRKKKK